MKKSASLTVLLGDGSLQSRWRQNAGAGFIRIRKNKFRSHFIYLIALILFVLILYIILPAQRNFSSSYRRAGPSVDQHQMANIIDNEIITYNSAYPLTKPVFNAHNKMTTYRIGLIADLDTNSRRKKDGNEYSSFIKRGWMSVSATHSSLEFKWDEKVKEVLSGYSLKGRGMELSELVTFNGKLYTFDDRTGIVFQVNDDDSVSPWIILTDGQSISQKGFKSEWATVKNHHLYVGSMGKEWTSAGGEFINYNPMLVKVVSPKGEVKTIDWVKNFKALRTAVGVEWPGYLIHESGAWSESNKKWFFLPRRCSTAKYNETIDETKGCNMLIIADETFTDVQKVTIGELKPTRGYSSFKFLPETHDSIIVALKTEELNGMTSTYVTAFDIKGNILHPDEKIHTEYKYEGFEFI